MAKYAPGRNSPCPCGSGKKYKHCCRLRDESATGTNSAPASESIIQNPATAASEKISDLLRQAIRDEKIESMEDMQEYADQLVSLENAAPREDFDGMSASDMYCFHHSPFEIPELVNITTSKNVVDTPVIVVFKTIIDAIEVGEAKATAKGNLPRKLCRDAAHNMLGADGYARATRYSGINSETDFNPVNAVRNTAELADLLRTQKGKWVVSGKGRDLLNRSSLTGVYTELLRVFCEKYNWGFQDRYPEVDIIQESWLYSMRLLSLYGDQFRDKEFYEKKFLTAFPASLAEASYGLVGPERTLQGAYSLRTFSRFAYWFGLIELSIPIGSVFDHDYTLKATPLLGEIFQFRV